MQKSIGEFTVTVWNGGYPVMVIISTDRGEIRFTHQSLDDIAHVISEARKAARKELPDSYKDEVRP